MDSPVKSSSPLTDEKITSYRQIFKATSLFGGVQAYNVLISLIRIKFVAVFLGPAGMGIMNLLTIPLNLIGQITGLGLGYSSVRDISVAAADGDEEKIGRTISVFRKWIWFTGLSGSILTLILSPFLSRWTFGNGDYTTAFLFLSIVLLFNALSTGHSATLQGMRRLRFLARATVIGSTFGLLVSIPLYYYFRIKGIVPTLIIASITSFVLFWFYGRRIVVRKPSLTWKEVWNEGNGMVKLGILITLSSLISSFISYLINIYISRTGGVDQVGLYQAGLTITERSIGLILVALGTDYYPRLSGVINDHRKMSQAVNYQAEIGLLIIGPILILLMTGMPVIIRLLYTQKFSLIMDLIPWIILGMPVKIASLVMGYILLAKGANKTFFFSELTYSIILLTLSIFGYNYMGLMGLGIAYSIMYCAYFVIVSVICWKKFQFHFSYSFYKIFLLTILFCSLSVVTAVILKFPIAYFTGIFLFGLMLWFSLVELNKRIGLKLLFKKVL
ncbi:MAG TPA: O-antigen translocase [Bacteroidales bacterium]|nr:O-antigen translocase [Bacteroidales bacterium]HPS74624.1 O-antigen translocase [Bacteroidales bacterium]